MEARLPSLLSVVVGSVAVSSVQPSMAGHVALFEPTAR